VSEQIMTNSSGGTGVLLCGHGSREDDARVEFERFVAATQLALAAREPGASVTGAYLEFAHPTIGEGLDTLAKSGATRIVAQPLMLFAAGHVKNDIPWEVNTFAAGHREVRVDCGRELSLDAKLLGAAADRAREAEMRSTRAVRRSDTLLLVIGRGTSDPDANGNIAKLARMLWEGLGMARAEVAFSGIAKPTIAEGLAHAARQGYPRVVVFPYFLFTGVLVKRIYRLTEEAARQFPNVEFLAAPYLADHPLVVETVVDRILGTGAAGSGSEGGSGGAVADNCGLCKYRTQIIGFEGDTGAPQVGHHHHVRGVLADPESESPDP
jgi:sirohydrochlorin cobaltochelatase